MEIQDFCHTPPVIDIDNPDFITTKKLKNTISWVTISKDFFNIFANKDDTESHVCLACY